MHIIRFRCQKDGTYYWLYLWMNKKLSVATVGALLCWGSTASELAGNQIGQSWRELHLLQKYFVLSKKITSLLKFSGTNPPQRAGIFPIPNNKGRSVFVVWSVIVWSSVPGSVIKYSTSGIHPASFSPLPSLSKRCKTAEDAACRPDPSLPSGPFYHPVPRTGVDLGAYPSLHGCAPSRARALPTASQLPRVCRQAELLLMPTSGLVFLIRILPRHSRWTCLTRRGQKPQNSGTTTTIRACCDLTLICCWI
jgi:hypothetical protein